MNLISKIELELKRVLSSIGFDYDDASLVTSNRPSLGDYQFNGAFNLCKIYHRSPVEIADKIVEALSSNDNFSNVNNENGFVNLSLSDTCLVNYINEVINDFNVNTYKVKDKKKIFLDYGGANVAKELHVGHLRSTNIGEAIKRLCEAVGNDTISDVHLGDWGRPMGLIILELKNRYPDLVYFDSNFNGKYPDKCPITIDELNEIYPFASAKAKIDPDYLNEARDITTRLQNKEKGYYELWKSFWTLSVNDIKRIYTKLNATFNLWEGESDADQYIPELLKYFKDNNMTEISEGATVINVKQDDDNREIPPVILIKSNGGVLYDTTELATLYSRAKRFDVDEYIYLTDNRQELHFVQAFRAAYKTKMVDPSVKLGWYGIGTMNKADGTPFKTRDGGILSLNNLINLVKDESIKVIKDNIKEEDKEELAEKIAIGAVKYADLLPNRASDYIFDPVKFSDLNGKTGPYLMYSTVRMKSLLAKCSDNNINPSNYIKISTKEERDIIINLLNMSSVLEKSYNSKTLNEICEYVYKLTNSFNAFYSNHEVLSEEDNESKQSFVSLTKLVYDTNMYLLNILAIEVPDKI